MTPSSTAKAFLIAAPKSGSGKTLISAGLMRAFAKRGRKVAPAKVGPDYIDPKFHELACGHSSVNLDGWAMRPDYLLSLAKQQAEPHELLMVEGVMGLFDGSVQEGQLNHGASSDVARHLGLPIVLVVDVESMGQSVGALVQGFACYDDRLNIAGVILNKAGSARHNQMLSAAMAKIGMPLIGILGRNDALALPSRHLGLVQASETVDLDTRLDAIASLMEDHLDLDLLVSLAEPLALKNAPDVPPTMPVLGQHIAVARDEAFQFIYPHVLQAWRTQGAQLSFFSPLQNEAPSGDADGVYLPGGYPELHAGMLAANEVFLGGVQVHANEGSQIYGECGGYMVLGQGLIDQDGNAHKMLGLLGLETSFKTRKLHLGYRKLTAQKGSLFARSNVPLYMAHEYHYCTTSKAQGTPLWTLEDQSTVGLIKGTVSGSFMHVIDGQTG